MRLIGHSFGSYVADELAEAIRFDPDSDERKVQSIVGLDPASDIIWETEYVPDAEIDFNEHSNCSWAFHSSDFAGSQTTPTTAREAFAVSFPGVDPSSGHSLIQPLFRLLIQSEIQNAAGELRRYFELDRLLVSARQVPGARINTMTKAH